eukprot:12424391-Karenia_brevis.AAC.1
MNSRRKLLCSHCPGSNRGSDRGCMGSCCCGMSFCGRSSSGCGCLGGGKLGPNVGSCRCDRRCCRGSGSGGGDRCRGVVGVGGLVGVS